MKKTKILLLVLLLSVCFASLPAFALNDDYNEFSETTEGPYSYRSQQSGSSFSEDSWGTYSDGHAVEGYSVAETIPSPAVTPRPAKKKKIYPSQLKKNWTAFLEGELTPGSESYVVKSGDSLYVIAKKHHTTVDLIKEMNGLKSDTIYPNMRLQLFTGDFSIKISKAKNTLMLYAEGKPLKKYYVSTGKNGSTPVGTFKIVNKLVDPTWFKTGAIYPPGSPDNALGTRWLGFDLDEYGIHGTIEPEKIGRSVSMGCIRMLNKDVEELYSIVPVGTEVTVTDR